jgi:hypothetical protein
MGWFGRRPDWLGHRERGKAGLGVKVQKPKNRSRFEPLTTDGVG